MAKRKPSEDLHEVAYTAPKVETAAAIETYSGKEFIGQKFDNTIFAETELAFADFAKCVFTDCKFYAKSIHNCNFKDAKFFKTTEKTVTDPKTKAVSTVKELIADNPMKDCNLTHCCVLGCNTEITVKRLY